MGAPKEALGSTELVIGDFETLNAAQIFDGDKLDKILEHIATKARALIPDVSTEAGRKAVASNAYKISRSKTYLDKVGKDHVAGLRATVKDVDAKRKRLRDTLDELRDEVREPLTKIEEAEREHEAEIKARIEALKTPWPPGQESGKIKARLDKVKAVEIDISFSKFIVDAGEAKDAAVAAGERALAQALEREQHEREQRERDETARAERDKAIAEKARLEERERIEREARVASIREETKVPVTESSLKSMEDALAPKPENAGAARSGPEPRSEPGQGNDIDQGAIHDEGEASEAETEGTTPDPIENAIEARLEEVDAHRAETIEALEALGIFRHEAAMIVEHIEAGEIPWLRAAF